jgi:anaerobic magnesium-protoporphyrin IX monomethyl ester cyclase
MRVALIGAELEENLGLRYMASALERAGHDATIIPFNTSYDVAPAVQRILALDPAIAGLSMVFTGRAREFCRLAEALRTAGYRGHIVAGGHFACLNSERLLADFPAFDSVGLGEGEEIMVALADHLDDVASIPGLCYRDTVGGIHTNPSTGNPDDLDALAFPRRDEFYRYFDKPIASILSSRGCWRDCAFCSINAWYQQGGGKKFRVRSVPNIVAEMSELYHRYGVRIYNFQDDNFFLASPDAALRRFEALRDGLAVAGVKDIAIAVKARPDSITYDTIKVLDELGLFRVFLGVENASARGLANLNRKCDLSRIFSALDILNDFDIHIAYNLLMFEPDTVMSDILTNLRFMERHVENPANFCRAEAYAGTGLEAKLRPEGRLLGDYFGFDYRLKDPHCEAFHQIANYAFFDRNFDDNGLHYFNMQVDFTFQLLRRFYPDTLTETLRAAVRNFIKRTNLDTYQHLAAIYDAVVGMDPTDAAAVQSIAQTVRARVDANGRDLYRQGEQILAWLNAVYEQRETGVSVQPPPAALAAPDAQMPAAQMGAAQMPAAQMPAAQMPAATANLSFLNVSPVPYTGPASLENVDLIGAGAGHGEGASLWDLARGPIPYDVVKRWLEQARQGEAG